MTDGCRLKKVVCSSRGSGDIFSQENFRIFSPLGERFVRFLKQIFGYTALHYTVDRLNLQLSTCMVCLCKYHNSITNLFSLAFQQLKSIGSEKCYPLAVF
jgi:hypothetical protein